MIIKEFKQFINYKLNKARQSKADKKYLLNLFGDATLLEQVIQKCNNDENLVAELITVDGTRLRLQSRPINHNSSPIDWERP